MFKQSLIYLVFFSFINCNVKITFGFNKDPIGFINPPQEPVNKTIPLWMYVTEDEDDTEESASIFMHGVSTNLKNIPNSQDSIKIEKGESASIVGKGDNCTHLTFKRDEQVLMEVDKEYFRTLLEAVNSIVAFKNNNYKVEDEFDVVENDMNSLFILPDGYDIISFDYSTENCVVTVTKSVRII